MSSVLIVSAEASSFLYAQRLLEYWKSHGYNIDAFGVGSREMESLGFHRVGRAEEMALFGIVEVFKHYPMLRKVFNNLVQMAKEKKPKLAILMDYPEFNLMLAKQLHALGIPVVYYISPQVWVWRQGRVHTIKKYCEKVLLLFPFEIPFYSRHQVPHEFVGHPLLDELDDKYFDPAHRKLRRNQCGINDDEIVLGLMPGSRRMELKQNFAIQLETARILSRKYPKLKILIMVAPAFDKEDLYPYLEDFKTPYILMKDEPFRMIDLSDLVLATSGTATLMVGLLQKPMVIIYRLKWLTALFARLFVRGARFFGIVNLISNREIVPEVFQEKVKPDYLAELLSRYIDDPEFNRKTKEDLAQLIHHLGNKGVTERVAHTLERYLTR